MFINLLPSSTQVFGVHYSSFAKTHYLKEFQKKYKGKQWDFTERSIFEDLSRLRMENNTTQRSSQIDELKHKDTFWLAKYDFKIAGTKESTKSSGNRCIVYINIQTNHLEILYIYHKDNLPKNCGETDHIMKTIETNFPNCWENLNN